MEKSLNRDPDYVPGNSLIPMILGIAFLLLLVYGITIIGKKINYWLFYDDSVKKEIVEMVKPECLIGHDEN